jgi:hypothetical protein
MRVPSRSNWPRWARAATTPWVLSPLLVLALLVGGFAGYGAWTRSQPTHYARGGDTFAATGSPGAVSTTPGPSGSVRPATRTHRRPGVGRTAPPAGTGVSPGGRSTPAPGSSGQSSAGGQVGPPPSGGSAAAAQPAVGTYTLAVSGSEHVKFGPFSACTNTFPSESKLVIGHASGEPAGSYDFDQRYYPNSANRHDERHIYRYTSGGVFLAFEQATVTCSGVKQSSAVNYSPQQRRVQLPLSVGATWHSHGGDSNRTEDATTKVVGTTNLTVGGRSYLTYVIDTHVEMSGDENGTRDQRWWFSPDYGMPLKWHESLSGSRSGATYSEDVTCTVVGTP